MDPVCMLLIIAAVLMYGAGLARASCALRLDGDAGTVARIEAALVEFPDDPTACIAVRVMCDRAGGEIALELQDELGRSAHRTFASPDGAAAFLISWSRRPMAFDGVARGTVASDGGAAPPSEAVPDGPPADPLRGEFHFRYIRPLEGGPTAMTAMAALVRRDGIWRYGGDLRLLGAAMHYDLAMLPVLWVASDAEATAGVEQTWLDRIRVRGEVVGGASYAAMLSMSDVPGVRTVTAHAGIRAMVASRLASAIWLEAGVGWDAVQTSTTRQDPSPLHMPPADPFLSPLRIEVGLQWAP